MRKEKKIVFEEFEINSYDLGNWFDNRKEYLVKIKKTKNEKSNSR